MAPGDYLTLEGTAADEREFTHLWTLATATYGVGDIVTTVALLYFVPHVQEANGLLRVATATFGQGGLVGVKLLTFLVCIGISVYGARVDDRLIYYLPPVALTLVGAFTTVYNLRLMLG